MLADRYVFTEGERNLACDHVTVFIGLVEATIFSCTETELQVRLPYTTAGTSEVEVLVAEVGLATNQANLQVTFVFAIESITPLSGSLAGGTQLTG